MKEFDFIETYLKPLVDADGAVGLTDDVARLDPSETCQIITTDSLVEGVHFLTGDPLETVAQKLVCVNVSDILAKGARPRELLLNCAWPHSYGAVEFEAFTNGLKRALEAWSIRLVGGDTVRTRGPLVLTGTLTGHTRAAHVVRRFGAQAGQRVWVTGQIGEGWLGLIAANEQHQHHDALIARLNPSEIEAVINGYRVPAVPSNRIADIVSRFATASVDVSDGLLADAAHIARNSDVTVTLKTSLIPLSDYGRRWLLQDGEIDWGARGLDLLTGGDDYQTLFTAPWGETDAILEMAAACDIHLTAIGDVVASDRPAVEVLHEDGFLPLDRLGWQH